MKFLKKHLELLKLSYISILKDIPTIFIVTFVQWSGLGFFYVINSVITPNTDKGYIFGLTSSIIVSLYILIRNTSKAKALSKNNFDTNQSFSVAGIVIFNIILIYAVYYSLYSLNSPTGLTNELRDCLYFSTVTFTTLGYGDFSPTPELRLVAATQAIVGYISLGIMISMLLIMIGQDQKYFEELIEEKNDNKIKHRKNPKTKKTIRNKK